MLNENSLTPVLFLVFNRPDTTIRVFEAIRKAQPARLYIAADGPRDNKPGEDLKVRELREYVMSRIDWKCEVKTLFRKKNLGCKRAVSSAIDWFFANEEEGIILEDDCLPDASFFQFCSQLLEKYRHNERVMMISGKNFYQEGGQIKDSYYFSKYNYIWGWASWRRAWKSYDVAMHYWPQSRTQMALLEVLSKKEYAFWRARFDEVYSGKLDTWDYQWTFACLRRNGVSVTPSVNLVENIGFGKEATHTQKIQGLDCDSRKEAMNFPLSHPAQMTVNQQADAFVQKHFFKVTPRDIVISFPDFVRVVSVKVDNFISKIQEGYSFLISRLLGRALIYVIGDSHSGVFKGRLGFMVRHVGSGTMYNLNKPKSSTGSNAKLFQVLKRLDPKKDAVLLVFGEIDARIHIYSQYEKSGREVGLEVLIDRTIANYAEVLKRIEGMGIRFLIQGIPAAARQGNYYCYQFYAPVKMRQLIYREFNTRLRQFCEQSKYPYIDVYSQVVDADGMTKKEYLVDELHLNYRIFPFVRLQLDKVLTGAKSSD